ncbi:hypothetical protein ARMGADRAFT_1085621 [Armillaria gallica]|uniref:Uncharacterized protein n=1 Tax=Armillaria gallica TaxID=47427 RepID=A0A2H3DJG8_ARMGA|nr:hypothetical protein ARMGADRAFT_1085621 [Armillaria gallica]
MSASPPLHPPFAEALATLRYCLCHPAESSDASMHLDAWVHAVFVSWRRLHTAWIYGENGFMDDRKWMALESQIWGLLAQVNQDLVNDCCDKYNDLIAEALKCGINIELIEMESESESEEVPPPAPSPEAKIPTPPLLEPSLAPVPSPQDLILPMPHTPTPEPRGSTPVPPPPKKYKFGPRTINDGPGFGLRRKQVEVRVPRLPAGFHAPPPRIPLPPIHFPLPSPAPELSPAPPVASSSRLRNFIASDEEQASPSKSLRQALPSPPHLTRQQKQKGRAPDTPGSQLRGRPRKIKEETVAVIRKHGGLGEPIPKNAHPLSLEDLRPMGLLVPDQDFGEYVGCQGAFFKRELAGKIGHFMSVPCDTCSKAHAQCRSVQSGSAKCFRCTIHKHDCVVQNRSYVNTLEPVFVPETPLVTEIRLFLHCLRQEGRQMNDSDGNILSLFLANYLDNIELVSELFEKGVKESEELVDLEAQEVPSDEDPDAEEEDELQGDE